LQREERVPRAARLHRRNLRNLRFMNLSPDEQVNL
jgi:hypothetical protein